ncbi:VIT1/CCC1 transporter family protein [Sporolactobacillus spathodeae]|uniref:VIT1/CCC1 family predicted Fe2+/Mn2+ transporter n=1 Tax=Sporolactobacillus spathodeae TaxID=1465502 RepID=A0ABS2Q9Q4_9BACL|nr:VIT family protein [Sporolactobacillus spathodeae]MBM7658521.1 VIT1/CCC1 family predicted Fe2+/Mn2+ transporter [Sporolactobacillus spathodeae]
MSQNENGTERINQKLNVLRAGVLGANDGIMSTAGLVLGVAGATTDTRTLLISGLAGIIAGAFSMGGGEYVSVSTQKDTEKAVVQAEKLRLHDDYEGERNELASIYRGNGLSEELSIKVADELMKKDAIRAHAQAELGVNPDDFINPWHAAFSSMLSFAIGAILPVLAIVLMPPATRVLFTGVSVFLALIATGYISAALGGAPKLPAIIRNVVVGLLIMALTYTVGHFI